VDSCALSCKVEGLSLLHCSFPLVEFYHIILILQSIVNHFLHVVQIFINSAVPKSSINIIWDATLIGRVLD
jgi:hypothetical protein